MEGFCRSSGRRAYIAAGLRRLSVACLSGVPEPSTRFLRFRLAVRSLRHGLDAAPDVPLGPDAWPLAGMRPTIVARLIVPLALLAAGLWAVVLAGFVGL